jgi:hypothetical protein
VTVRRGMAELQVLRYGQLQGLAAGSALLLIEYSVSLGKSRNLKLQATLKPLTFLTLMSYMSTDGFERGSL